MELIELSVAKRESTGKGAARKLRADNVIPGIIYGAKIEPVKVSIDVNTFDKVIREHGTTGLFFDLKVEGETGRMVMLKEIQMDPFGLRYLHIDFHEIDMDATVSIVVPVEVEGISAGVKEGGMVQIIRRDLEVICKPKDTPESIKLDISELEIGDSIHVADIDLGAEIEIPFDTNFTVVTIVPPESGSDDEEGEEVAEAAAG
ncbi:MAG: 50S ribosomal protein L25/general stress protein Ctc [Desulfobacter sp.]|jgi:large subunit ribosomal protein L25|uniref:50S ribosomal protein L25/general stress protein Ctc n=1 Tax=Desulfobacter sp. TaxID=2294 RepID=UPI000E88FADE|nr:50S ribosomal protein L25/general stress protein Ctc [Desulfobacter sp.]MBP8828291.1 50S ribosomal protein L25/general stress protein Ctc [Desulfobacter sp.]MBP9597767.1 50S ribosomal protein L25/general stress protein Ctc [Desulfobacter sp.]MDQ1269177.1 ribosomal protein [Thermodesulfobacteriota bacterium]HBT87028.1 50S ribosomal protein L25 [Desulfobacter sp.]